MKSLVLFSLLFFKCHTKFVEYNSEYARDYFDYAAAVYSKDAMQCLSNTVSTANLLMLQHAEFPCMNDKSNCKVLAVSSEKDKIIRIAVKGPNEIDKIDKDFLRKIRGTVEYSDFGLIDHNFSNAHRNTWRIIESVLKSENTSGFDIVFIGHSTGGAMATLAALQAYRIGVPSHLIHLYTYGEPRIGNILFAHNVDRLFADSWRIVNAQDVVPHLASCRDDNMDINFGKDCAESSVSAPHHHGVEVWYNWGMGLYSSYKICTKNEEDLNCSDGLITFKLLDHFQYFDRDLTKYDENLCAKNVNLRFRYNFFIIMTFCSTVLLESL